MPIKYGKPMLLAPSGKEGEFDSTHAHKIYHDGALYRLYCAVHPTTDDKKAPFGNEFRCITVARSKPF